MRFLARTASVVAALAAAGGVAVLLAQERPVDQAATRELPPGTRGVFNGVWDYNSEESVDAATGRPEQSPLTAAQRRSRERAGTATRSPGSGGGGGGFGGGGGGSGGGLGGGGGGIGGGGVGGGSGGSGGGSGGGGGFGGGGGGFGGGGGGGMGPAIIASINRSLSRDLLEVPEQLSIDVKPEAVTFIDDLERSFTYPTDGSKQEYIMSAAKFDARVTWDGVQLRKEVAAARGFKMTETYFLSADGKRLFVIIRIGEQPPPEGRPVNGVNRVYDRVVREHGAGGEVGSGGWR
jgi:hypothetical protein